MSETPGQVLRRLWADHNRRISYGEYPRAEIWDRVTAAFLAEMAQCPECHGSGEGPEYYAPCGTCEGAGWRKA